MRLGPWEIALIAMFVIILFGAKKIPEIMRGLGQGVKEFKGGMRGMQSDTPPPTQEKTGTEESTKTD